MKAGSWVLKTGFMPIRYEGVLGRSQPCQHRSEIRWFLPV